MKNDAKISEKRALTDRIGDAGINLNPDLSYIDNLKDLQATIHQLEAKVKVDGYVLKQGLSSLPSHAFRSAASTAMPLAFQKTSTGKSFNIGKVVLGYFLSKPWKKGSASKGMASEIAKLLGQEIGYVTIFKFVRSLFKKKKK